MFWGASCRPIRGALCSLPAVPGRRVGRLEVGCGGGCVFRVGRWVISAVGRSHSPAMFIEGGGVLKERQERQERQERPRAGVHYILSCRFWAASWLDGVPPLSEVWLVSGFGLVGPQFGRSLSLSCCGSRRR